MVPVPSRFLLGIVLVLALVGTVAGPVPWLVPYVLVALALLAVILLFDFIWSARRLPRPRVSLPRSARLSKDRLSHLEFRFDYAAEKSVSLRIGVALPAGFSAPEDEAIVALPASATKATLSWPCTPSLRGSFEAVVVCLEQRSLLGLWQLRQQQKVTTDIRVYPNLFTERKQLAALFLARAQAGAKVQRTVGRGRDFEKLREYQPGDGFEEIHWKATGKRNRPITKVFQAERTQEIYVIVDASRLSARPVEQDGVTTPLLERYLTAALVLLVAAEQQGDRFGLGVFDSRLHTFVKAGHGEGHHQACREAVCRIKPSDSVTDVSELIRALRTRLTRRSLLFFLTDLSDPVLAEDYARLIRPLARQHLVFINQLPAPGIAPLFSGAPVADATEIPARVAGHVRWSEMRNAARRLKAQGATCTLLRDESLAAQLVSEYLEVKRRQIL